MITNVPASRQLGAPTQEFGQKDPGAEEYFYFDFTGALVYGTETITAATVTCYLLHGTDPAVSSMPSGSATIEGSGKYVKQLIQAGVTGCNYLLVCSATTSAGNSPVIAAGLSVGPI